MMADEANTELTPEQQAELGRQAKLETARSELIVYAGSVFTKLGWRVRVTANWSESPGIGLRLQCSPPIDNYVVTLALEEERLLAEDHSSVLAEIDALPGAMISSVFGGSAHLIMLGF